MTNEVKRDGRLLLNYVRRCKKKTGSEKHKTLHAADDDVTFCGKELSEMWFIHSSAGLEPKVQVIVGNLNGGTR